MDSTNRQGQDQEGLIEDLGYNSDCYPCLNAEDVGMAFSNAEIVRYTNLIEQLIWSKLRPPLHMRNLVREGQRIAGQEIELFLVMPAFSDPQRQEEESIAKARYVKSREVWQVFWKRRNLKWHRYSTRPEVKTLAAFLKLVKEDANGCFWG